jgi:hypothetical protein
MYRYYDQWRYLFEGEIVQYPIFCITYSKAGGGLLAKFTRNEDGLSTRKFAARLTTSLY